MKIKWNEVMRFSQIVAIVLFVAIFLQDFVLVGSMSEWVASTKTSLVV